MKIPKVPSRKTIEKLSRVEITERLKAFELDWATLRQYDDEEDSFLTKPPKNAPSHAEQEHALNVLRLHKEPIRRWISELTASDIQKVCKEYRIEMSTWTKRSASLEELRRQLSYHLPEIP
jgi:hypothetical protein